MSIDRVYLNRRLNDLLKEQGQIRALLPVKSQAETDRITTHLAAIRQEMNRLRNLLRGPSK